MSQTTKIEWCDSTLNLEMGCDGCELWTATERHCYAGTLHERWGGKKGWAPTFTEPTIFMHRLDDAERWPDLRGRDRTDKPWLNGRPRVIFLNDLGDTFTESLPINWLEPVLPRMEAMPVLWIVLTKRAHRMAEFGQACGFPKNFMLLVSVTSEKNTNRIEQLLRLGGDNIKGVSLEPQLSSIDIERYLPRRLSLDEIPGSALNDGCCEGRTEGLDWVIQGGESGPGARPMHPYWVRTIRDQCQAASMAYFFKQWGAWLPCGCLTDDPIAGLSFMGCTGSTTEARALEDEPNRYKLHRDGQIMERVGKKAAGAIIDGREWREFPEVPRA